MPDIRALYTALTASSRPNLLAPVIAESIVELCRRSLSILNGYNKVPIKSTIANKRYFVFQNGAHYSRPVNADLFLDEVTDALYQAYIDLTLEDLPLATLDQFLYTMGMSYCAATDALGLADKKTPSVFFEIYIGNLFARSYETNPVSQIIIDMDEIKTSLPTDFLFQPNKQFVKIHLPIKLSTRERSIQAWAHQRVLEGIHGVGKYKGVMVVMAETNFQKKGMSVVEVCLPDQWRLYQMYISKMTRIYYLDIPKKYEDLIDKFPYIQVKPLSQFFKEKTEISDPRT